MAGSGNRQLRILPQKRPGVRLRRLTKLCKNPSGWTTDVRELSQQPNHTFELVQESVRKVNAACIAVEPRRLEKVILSTPMELQ
jgi:hypothetical protein